jgi:hypothetical protein
MRDRITEALNDFDSHLRTGLDDLRSRITSLEKSLDPWQEVAAWADVPGVKAVADELRDRLEHLRKGEVLLHWRPEVYEHDRALLETLKRSEIFKAAVPPLDKDSFDDPEFVDFIGAQKAAAADGRLKIERIYLFANEQQRKERLAEPVIRNHLDELFKCSRNMKVFTAVTKNHQTDLVIFGKQRCSVSRGNVDGRKYERFPVLYTSEDGELKRCNERWNRLKDVSRDYKPGEP